MIVTYFNEKNKASHYPSIKNCASTFTIDANAMSLFLHFREQSTMQNSKSRALDGRILPSDFILKFACEQEGEVIREQYL